MGILDTMKQVSMNTIGAGSPASFMFGQVSKSDPLTIRVDNRFDISGDAIVLMKEFKKGPYKTHYHIGFKEGAKTKATSGGSGESAFEYHYHELSSDYQTNTDDQSEHYYGLEEGDKVVLLKNAGGQEFLVLGRL